MTKQQWLACASPVAMLEFARGKVSNRKLRLFGIALCRRVWPILIEDRSRRALEIGERSVEGTATTEEVAAAHRLALEAVARRRQATQLTRMHSPSRLNLAVREAAASRASTRSQNGSAGRAGSGIP